MSRRKKSKPPAKSRRRAPSDVSQPGDAPPAEPAQGNTTSTQTVSARAPEKPAESPAERSAVPHSGPGLLLLAAGIGVVWLLFLVGLALLTANPVTLNQRQVARADFVVTGVVDEPEAGTVTVQWEWKRGAELGTVTVEGLAEYGVESGGEYLLPLSRINARRFVVTRVRDDDQLPAISPATPDAVEQLQRILKGQNGTLPRAEADPE